MSGSQQSADRPALFEELRFAKRQQWYVAASAVTLNAGILALTRGSPLNGIEPLLAVFFILLIAAGSTAVLWDLQDHLLRVRGDLDLYGSSPGTALPTFFIR